jgi:hypothetical protein
VKAGALHTIDKLVHHRARDSLARKPPVAIAVVRLHGEAIGVGECEVLNANGREIGNAPSPSLGKYDPD